VHGSLLSEKSSLHNSFAYKHCQFLYAIDKQKVRRRAGAQPRGLDLDLPCFIELFRSVPPHFHVFAASPDIGFVYRRSVTGHPLTKNQKSCTYKYNFLYLYEQEKEITSWLA